MRPLSRRRLSTRAAGARAACARGSRGCGRACASWAGRCASCGWASQGTRSALERLCSSCRQTRARFAARRFSRVLRSRARNARSERSGAGVHSPRRGQRASASARPFLLNRLRPRPCRRVATARAATAREIWDDIRDELRARGSRLQVPHLARAARAGRRCTAATSTCGRPSTSGPGSRERYLPLLRRAAARALDDARDRRGRRRATGRPADAADGAEPATRASRRPQRAGLNPKYTLRAVRDRRGNRFAHAAALAVAELPGPGLQPALPPRPARARQDPPAPRHRQLRRALRRRA